ncbi:YjcZ family sporulation protein [Lederbergia graminis]|uniref:YjcZ family sporulation protein n=1 Tax=Lederbergia graminis TaxID=735518 RepID=A0ABW0LBW2_9BACI|nr:YjcZ family sporulation protein [Paenibacillus bovis]HLU21369.1 YjcZ family sporulation protein [Bacillaceae bacterium]
MYQGYGCHDYCYPSYGYGYVGGVGNSFALIVVLFILLIIIGACWAFPK